MRKNEFFAHVWFAIEIRFLSLNQNYGSKLTARRWSQIENQKRTKWEDNCKNGCLRNLLFCVRISFPSEMSPRKWGEHKGIGQSVRVQCTVQTATIFRTSPQDGWNLGEFWVQPGTFLLGVEIGMHVVAHIPLKCEINLITTVNFASLTRAASWFHFYKTKEKRINFIPREWLIIT